MSLRTEVRECFGFLFSELGFQFVEAECSDLVLVAQSTEIRVRFVKDRADFFVDIASIANPHDWEGLYELIEVLRRSGQIAFNGKYVNKIQPASATLRNYYEVLKRKRRSEVNPTSQPKHGGDQRAPN